MAGVFGRSADRLAVCRGTIGRTRTHDVRRMVLADMTDAEMLAEIWGNIPPDADRIIVIYPCAGQQSACRWFGMTPEGVAKTLYQMADGVVTQRIPLPKLRQG